MISIKINGIVQGVGFRPFVYSLAQRLGVQGYILNSKEGVEIEAEGPSRLLEDFVSKIKSELPPAAKIEELAIRELPNKGYQGFEIRESVSGDGITFISPDLALCGDCLKEMQNGTDPRYNYSFINCTNCGPRYSIIDETPYDRPATSMKDFQMCDYCCNEYKDPANRRFHAQPIACPQCGPRLVFLDKNLQPVEIEAESDTIDPIALCFQELKRGKIIGIKGIGGFHIACDATNEEAVRELRRRKRRPDKPFAVMCKPDAVRKIVKCPEEAFRLLSSPASPIVLLPRLANISLADSVAPLNPNIGLFFPYAPQHYQLLNREKELYLVMTSGNINDEPIAVNENEINIVLRGEDQKDASKQKPIGSNSSQKALPKFPKNYLCDFFLTHNRRILNRNDDSVILPSLYGSIFVRRSRGFVPVPLNLPCKTVPTLGTGAELKIVFALTTGDSLYLSPYIGNNRSKATEEFYFETLKKYQKWFGIEPELVACDLHPDYLTTHIAERLAIPLIKTQHHHAHIAAVMAEKMLDERVIGVSYDGTGMGTDGAIWGGEIYTADYASYKREYHLSYMPLVGGDESVRHPVRIAYTYLSAADEDPGFLKGMQDSEKRILKRMLENKQYVFQTSSMGRLFDCVAAMLGLFPEITFEAQSAMALEYLCGSDILNSSLSYPYEIEEERINIKPLLREVKKEVLTGVEKREIAEKFHRTVVNLTVESVTRIRQRDGLNKVVLSGGVMQNRVLLEGLIERLRKNSFTVYYSSALPSNDGAVAVGQAMIANRQ